MSAIKHMAIAHLRVEYLVDPQGIDVPAPRLSWVLRSDVRNQIQTAYQVLVASTSDGLAKDVGDLWDSGKKPSDQTAHIVYGGKRLTSRMQVHWKVRVWDKDGKPSAWSAPAFWSMGLLQASDWKAQWIEAPVATADAATPPTRQPAPLLRKRFAVDGRIKRAVAYASALGLYELRLNGQRVGDQLLAPEWTDYHTRVQYQTHDVTALLRTGDNAIGALLGDGWYTGRIGLSSVVPNGPAWGIYGPSPRFLAQLEIEFADGRKQVVVTNDTWRCATDGPVRGNDIFDGETYDARKEFAGWDAPGFDDAAWAPARVASGVTARLVAQPNEPIRVVQDLEPVALTEPKPGVYIFDLGQNMVGWCRLRAQTSPGATITLRHGEALNPDGTLYTANLRGATQVDRYTFRGNTPETFEPHFTYHGFRYAEVTGLPAKPAPDALLGRVFNSSSPEIGRFECSSAMLNRLMQNILWTQRANIMSTPTDCPQRDERLGWMGDIQVFSQTAIFNMDLAAFFTKWVRDIRDAQAQDGRFPDFAPHPFGPNERLSGVPAWGDAGTIVPWRVYQNYGDTRLLAEHFDAATRWIEYIRRNNPDLVWRNGRNRDYNDWLNADTLILDDWPKTGGEVPKEVFATAFFAQSTELVAKMAAVLGRREDAATYAKLADDIKAAFNSAFVTPDGRIHGNTQAGYALALHFDLLPENLRAAAAGHMLEAIHRYKDHMSTGIQSTIRLMLELTRTGHNDVAYQLINNRTMPSWGYSIDQGATTIWERWDGYVAGRGFQQPGMNSFNHWALGAVGEWMWRNVAGISPDDEQPGYKHIVIHPRPGGGLTWARGEYDSIRGPIVCAWKVKDCECEVDVAIPANTTATVYVPTQDIANVTESGKPIREADGVKYLRMDRDAAVFEIGSGRYVFRSQ